MTHLALAAALVLPSSDRARIDDIVAQVMRVQHIAGLSLGIARRGTMLYLRGYGMRDVERRIPANGYTIFRAGSIAKQFAAALVLRASERGTLSIAGRLRSYLPSLPNDVGDVSIAELLGQTSGIAPESDATHPTLAHEPGGAWVYANANYLLLGMALRAATGTAYSVHLARLAGALSLVSTGCGVSPFTQNVARGYAWSGGFAPVADAAGGDASCSAFGIASNAADLLRWLESLRSGRVVSAADFTKMSESGTLSDGTPTHYGYGFFVANWFGYDVAEHSGYVPGFSCEDALVLRDGIELVVMSNAEAVDLTPLAKSVVAILEPPLDRNLSAAPGAQVQNENPRVTAALAAIVRTPGFADLGTLQTIEFIERTASSDLTYDTYRLTFSSGIWRAKVGYRAAGAIVSLSLEPAGHYE